MPDASPAQADPPRNRIWRVGAAEFDEARRELRVGGELRAVEAKPLLLFEILLSRAGDTARKEELLAAVWQDRTVVEQSLTTAVSKLRAALGDEGRAIVEAVHGVGYRIGLPMELRAAPEKPRLAFNFQPGDPVPNRPQWCLERPLGNGAANDVWLARHSKTGEQRVFKFADTTQRLDALRREAALSRILHQALGDRPDLVRISEWNFDTRPFFIESAYGGDSLPSWAEARGGLTTIPLARRIGIVARIARTVAAAHDVGVLHRDIKPSNVLVSETGNDLTIRLVDFGSGRLTETARLQAVTVTGLGLTAAAAHDGERLSGTLRYMAPETLAGGPPTIAADVYALGILLFQIVVGDLNRLLGAGWETDVADSLLREDVAAAAAGDVSRRLTSAAVLAEHLEHLEARRAERDKQVLLSAKSAQLARQVERSRLRRPWLILTAMLLVTGSIGTSVSAIRATRARDEAQRQAELVIAVNRFLTQDLLGRGDPVHSGKANETLMEAAAAAEPRIKLRLSREPLVAASIYLALGEAFEGRSAFTAARNSYSAAEEAFDRAEGSASADSIILMLRRARLEVIASDAGFFQTAQDLLAKATPLIGSLGQRTAEGLVWFLETRERIDRELDRDEVALGEVTAAADLADTMPLIFDREFRFDLHRNEAMSLTYLEHFDAAEAVLRQLRLQQLAIAGPLDADTLLAELSLAIVTESRRDYVKTISEIDKLYPKMQSVFGPGNRQTNYALMIRAQARVMLGQYEAAVVDDMTVYRWALASNGGNSSFALQPLSDAAVAECRSGNAQTGLAHAMEAYGSARSAYGEQSDKAQLVSANVAFCQTVMKQYSQAELRLSKIDPRKAAQADLAPDELIASIDLMRADAAQAAGNVARAFDMLRQPRRVFDEPNADPYFRRWTNRLLAALNSK